MARLTQADVYKYYENLMDRIYLNHHTYPTNIPNYRLTGSELAEMSELDATGREIGRDIGGGRSAGHKCAVFHRDPDFCNGLPRKGR